MTTIPQPTTYKKWEDKITKHKAKKERRTYEQRKEKDYNNVNDNAIMQCSQNTNEKIHNKALGWVGVFNFFEEMKNVNNY